MQLILAVCFTTLRTIAVFGVLSVVSETPNETISASQREKIESAPSAAKVEMSQDPREVIRSSARTHFRVGQFDKALADMDCAIKLSPMASELFVARARCWLAMNNPRKAVDDAGIAIRLNSDSAEGYGVRGKAWIDLEEFESAIADFTEAIHRQPNASWPYLWRGHCRLVQRRFEGAVQDFRKSLQIDPTEYEARLGLGFLLTICPDQSLRDGGQAVELVREDFKSGTGHDAFRTAILAAAYAEKGDFKSAVETQCRALALGDRPLEGRCVLVLYMLNCRPQACFFGGLWRPATCLIGFCVVLACWGNSIIRRRIVKRAMSQA